ncbi:MAG: allophanate hydrolase subunit 1 [Actinobacteria bacterium]|nr:allophanate hydrolase subunit 1 [Actinomycetota bacterium]
MTPTLRPMGEHAVLIELDDIEQVVALDAVLRPRLDAGSGVWAGVQDMVPAARTVLFVVGASADLSRLGEEAMGAAGALEGGVPGRGDGEVVELQVRYDGPDLDDVAAHTGLSRDEVVSAHTGQTWRVGFFGFAPGFGYLVGEDDRLHVPRRDEPRTKVPAGSVGLAGEFSSVYPRESPGGWQLIGSTEDPMWDSDRDPPALLHPGSRVRFVEVGGQG